MSQDYQPYQPNPYSDPNHPANLDRSQNAYQQTSVPYTPADYDRADWQATYDQAPMKAKSSLPAALMGVIIAFVLIGGALGAFLLLSKRAESQPQSFSSNVHFDSANESPDGPVSAPSLAQKESIPEPARDNPTPVPPQPVQSNNQSASPSSGQSASQPSSSSSGQRTSPEPVYASIENYKTPTSQPRRTHSDCPASLLNVGDFAFANPPTGGGTMRDGAYGKIQGHSADKFYAGALFEVIDGPVCDSRVNMYKVRTSWDTEYWVPEAPATGDEWWLLPLQTRKVCSDAKPTRLLVGMKAFVLEYPDDPVEVYPEPVLDSSRILYRIQPTQHDPSKTVRQPTEVFELLKGPHCDGKGANWWYVRVQNGTEGWIRETGPRHDYYYIGPYFAP